MNCYYEYSGMNAPYLESSEQLNRLFAGSLNQINFHIFKNISKYSIHILRPFKYKNMCKLCDITEEKEREGKIRRIKVLFFTRKLLISFITNFIFTQ